MREMMLRWDTHGVLWFCDRRRGILDAVMKLFTRIGNGYAWLLLALGFGMTGGKGAGLFLALASGYAIELSLYVLIKRRVSRVRPFKSVPGVTMLVHPPDEFSFPSGHTAAAFVMVTVSAWWYPVLLLPLLPLAVGIGLSRVYLGVHFPSDVVAGALLGISAGIIPAILLA